MKYGVLYASAGCLPDDRMGPFDTIHEAAEYVRDEWWLTSEIEYENGDENSTDTVAPTIEEIIDKMGAEDPREGSLYSWEIIELSDDDSAKWEEELYR